MDDLRMCQAENTVEEAAQLLRRTQQEEFDKVAELGLTLSG
jgi:hypothetical protein